MSSTGGVSSTAPPNNATLSSSLIPQYFPPLLGPVQVDNASGLSQHFDPSSFPRGGLPHPSSAYHLTAPPGFPPLDPRLLAGPPPGSAQNQNQDGNANTSKFPPFVSEFPYSTQPPMIYPFGFPPSNPAAGPMGHANNAYPSFWTPENAAAAAQAAAAAAAAATATMNSNTNADLGTTSSKPTGPKSDSSTSSIDQPAGGVDDSDSLPSKSEDRSSTAVRSNGQTTVSSPPSTSQSTTVSTSTAPPVATSTPGGKPAASSGSPSTSPSAKDSTSITPFFSSLPHFPQHSSSNMPFYNLDVFPQNNTTSTTTASASTSSSSTATAVPGVSTNATPRIISSNTSLTENGQKRIPPAAPRIESLPTNSSNHSSLTSSNLPQPNRPLTPQQLLLFHHYFHHYQQQQHLSEEEALTWSYFYLDHPPDQ